MMNQLYPLKIIIVDDEERIIQNISKSILSLDDATQIVATAYNGEDALKLISKHRPHIVFTDIKMPKMDGLELAREIKRQFPNIYVVIISGFSHFEYAQQAIKYGVFNYLLKPIAKEKIVDVIAEIRKNIIATIRSHSQREIIIPENGDNSLNNSQYCVFLICLNNLCHDPMDEEIRRYYDDHINSSDWKELFEELHLPNWVLVDEYYSNEKVIVVGQDHDCNPKALARRIIRKIEKKLWNMPITVCTHQEGIVREEIWGYTQRLRNLLHQRLVPTKVNFFILEQDEKVVDSELRYSIKSRIDQNFKTAVKAKNYSKIQEELLGIIDYMGKAEISQKHYEKALVSMLQVLELYLEGFDTEEADKLRIELFRKLHYTRDHSDIKDKMMVCLNNYFRKATDHSDNIQEEILDYVNTNFITIDRVEDIAERFNYNYTYLSRLFKKMTGVSMSKYITKKRIELAKEIMMHQPNLSLSEVGAMVGYNDPHYFSRAFKVSTGMSPSNYKTRN
ncbi:response regulator [Vallitalea okinawensis]|uniref:response regulator n=1 Tax=Vallitalea okinawensis TaxID=2078660 RepID=UPI000CFD888F|nr:response regulator [Vallitalea okinawensis]